MMNTEMTKAERSDLAKFIRRREKAAKTAAAQRAAELRADAEKKLCAIYTPDDDATFRRMYDDAIAAAERCQAEVEKRCTELGIPATFAPSLDCRWYGRGENALKDRREELRKAAYARIDALEAAARTRIEVESVELEGKVIANGLTSEAATQFLAAMPTVDQLMPLIDSRELKALIGNENS